MAVLLVEVVVADENETFLGVAHLAALLKSRMALRLIAVLEVVAVEVAEPF